MDDKLKVLRKIIDHCLNTNVKTDINRILLLINSLAPFASAAFLQFKVSHRKIEHLHKMVGEGIHKQWIDIYQENNFAMIDPVVLNARCEYRAFEWHEAFKMHPCQNKQFMDYMSKFGLKTGIAYAYPFDLVSGRLSLLSLQLDDTQDVEHYKFILECLLPHIHYATEKYLKIEDSHYQLDLSSRELEVLKWVEQGKKSREIGRILEISENTVKYHLSNVFMKLDVTNRVQAIAKARTHHLIGG